MTRITWSSLVPWAHGVVMHPPSHKRLLRLLILLGMFAAMALAGTRYLWAGEPYSIYVTKVGEAPRLVTTSGRFTTVAEVLEDAGIPVGPADLVTPALVDDPMPDVAIQVHRALSVTVRTDDDRQVHWTHQRQLGPFLAEAGLAVGRVDRVYADGVPLTFGQLDTAPLPARLDVGRTLDVTIQDGGRSLSLRTAAQTVGEALAVAGITIYAADGVLPPMGQWLGPDMVIQVRRSVPLTIHVDDRVIQTRSHHTRVLDVLAEAGIGLVGADTTRPPPDATVRANGVITVIRVTETFRFEDTPLPFETRWQATDQVEIDATALLQAGVPGIQRQRVRVRFENGVEASQTPDGSWIALEPVPEIIGYGTKIVIRQLETPEGPLEYWRKVRMRVTSYTAATSGKDPDHPAYGITRSGLPAGKGIVAVDPTVVPWRTNVYVPGYGVGLAADTGGGVKGRWVDLGYPEDNYIHWSGYRDVYFLTPVPPVDQINYLIPRTLP